MSSKYIRKRLESPRKFDTRSFRTIAPSGGKGVKIIVACPRGKYRKNKCSTGLKVQSVLYPK